jgi:hypothetical protein
VFNLAGHYGWDVGLLSDSAKAMPGVAFIIAVESVPGVPTGIVQPAAFWSGSAVAPCGADGFIYARVPAACAPETVLERLAAI